MFSRSFARSSVQNIYTDYNDNACARARAAQFHFHFMRFCVHFMQMPYCHQTRHYGLDASPLLFSVNTIKRIRFVFIFTFNYI